MGKRRVLACTWRVALILLGAVLFSRGAYAQYHSTITFINGTNDDALVKLIGPTRTSVAVSAGQRQTADDVAPGSYYVVVRYGNGSGAYSYTKGDPFSVEEYGNQYSQISMTLHKVANGNYQTRPANEAEFDNAP